MILDYLHFDDETQLYKHKLMPLRRKIRSGYIIALVLLLISYFFIFLSVWNVQREYDWLTDSYKAENRIGELRNSIVETETRRTWILYYKRRNPFKTLPGNARSYFIITQ